MSQSAKKRFPAQKNELHPRNRHRSRYDFSALVTHCPELATFLAPNAYSDISVNFADPAAVKMLNRALLLYFYQLTFWDIPDNYLCPPVPGRADYLHYLADLLAGDNQGVVPQGKNISVLDIGVGANCIYPIIGQHEYGWRFTGAESDPQALHAARQIIANNPTLTSHVRLRQQKNSQHIFHGIINASDRYDAVICNPPFHASAEEAMSGTRRKLHNLGLDRDTNQQSNHKPQQNFGGQSNELWCEGGEEAFISRMISESVAKAEHCLWFTSLVSKQTTLPALYRALKQINVTEVRTIEMAQGQKISRFIAWTFKTTEQRARWARSRWKNPQE